MLNLIGNKYNKLTVVDFVGRDKKGTSIWKCICECGGMRLATSSQLRSLNAKSCGCLFKNNKGKTKHGESKNRTTEYKSWIHMRVRCTNINHKHYENYGGRGISVCDSWNNSFENFLKDMGRAPSSRHTLERNDPNGNYEVANCKWATRREQANNRKNSVRMTIDGVTKNFKEWCLLFGISCSTAHYRKSKGYSIEKIFSNGKS